MADGKQFDFLLAAWGVEANDAAKADISENVEALNRKSIEEYIKDSDIRKMGLSSSLPKGISSIGDMTIPPGKYFCQVSKFSDMTQPTKFQEEGDKKWRLLALDMADGEQKFRAVEYVTIPGISSDSWPGTKILLHSTTQSPLYVRNSHILLTPQTVEVLGGEVWKLMENWKASKEVEATRLQWKQDGVKKQVAGEGAPPWVDFDPKKARYSGNAKSIQEERAEWQKAPEGAKKEGEEKPKEKVGNRFQAADFREEDAPQVHSKVSHSAFKEGGKLGSRAQGKGKERGGDDDGGGKGKGKRRGRDDDYEEEKRAPSHSSMGLAAFIKPTKDGKLPDEAVDALTTKSAPKPAPKPVAAAPASAGWGAEASWEGESWGEASWGEASWGASTWSSSGGGGGGGKGKSRGKGSSGGGKGKGGASKGKGGSGKTHSGKQQRW